jgi:hypothetical protein
LECANLAPFGTSVRRVTGLPVFDLYTLGMHAYFTCVGTEFVASSTAADTDRGVVRRMP